MTNQKDGGGEPVVLDIDDRPILAGGCPPDSDPAGQDRWTGSMMRAVVDVFHKIRPGDSWIDIRYGLGVLAQFLHNDFLRSPGFETDVEFDHGPVLDAGCPSSGAPQEQHRWAESMTLTLIGLMMSQQPAIQPDGVMHGLTVFARFVRSEGGPLTWST